MITSSSTEPAILLDHFRAGGGEAMKMIFDLHFGALSAYAFSLVTNSDIRDDIVSETFIKCWENRMNLDRLEGIRFWLFRVARNACLDHLKYVSMESGRAEKSRMFYSIHEGENVAEIRAQLLQEVILASSDLPEKMKQVFGLLYLDNVPVPDVATRLGISPNTVLAQRQNAIKRIRQILAVRGITSIWFL